MPLVSTVFVTFEQHIMARRNAKLLASQDERTPISFESNGLASLPKHVALPKLGSGESEWKLESHLMLLFLVSMSCQYLNLYRTVWWLTQSHTHTVINLHLIDLNVVLFNMTFMGRGFIHQTTLFMCDLLCFYPVVKDYMAHGMSLLLTYFMIKFAFYIFLNHGIAGILCIAYPFIIYVLCYFTNIVGHYERCKSFERKLLWSLLSGMILPSTSTSISSPSSPTKSSPANGHLHQQQQQPIHCCSSNTTHIREEIERLRTIFNNRLKYIVFKSLLMAYYSCIVPLMLVQPQLYYDVSWTGYHVAVCGVSSFLLLTSHLYSPHFYDVLHKSALHLGKWQRLETRNTLVPCTQWSDKILYAQGVVVRHQREYFKAEGVANCAEPGNQSHLRFYVVFSNPVGGFGTLLGLLVMLILTQLTLLIRSHEWFKLISMSSMIVVNCMTIFRLVRSYYVLREVYKVEQSLQDSSHLRSQ